MITPTTVAVVLGGIAVLPGAGSVGGATGVIACFTGVIGSHLGKRDWHVMLPVAAVALSRIVH
jgi:hypothetical protein